MHSLRVLASNDLWGFQNVGTWNICNESLNKIMADVIPCFVSSRDRESVG